jgi:hypothetical protein
MKAYRKKEYADLQSESPWVSSLSSVGGIIIAEDIETQKKLA